MPSLQKCSYASQNLYLSVTVPQNQNFVAIMFQVQTSKPFTAQVISFLAFLCDLRRVFRFLILFSVLQLRHYFAGMSTGIIMISMFTSFFLGALFTAVTRVNMFVVLEIVMLIFVKMAFRHLQLRLATPYTVYHKHDLRTVDVVDVLT